MKRRFVKVVLAAAALCLFCWWQNNGLMTTELTVTSPEIPETLSGARIVHLSDLHGKDFGERLIDRVRAAAPDLIVVTGDLIDRSTDDLAPALRQMAACAALAPTYYVTGNHEAVSPRWGTLREGLIKAGVTVLEDERAVLELRGEAVSLAGLHDPAFGGFTAQAVSALCPEDAFAILLAHRPERLDDYAAGGADLVFSGHAHGGQFRIPGLGGLVAPGQDFFPAYTSGLYRQDGTVMAVSRGLGNSIIPLRLLNRPEVVVVTLRAEGEGA